LDNKVRTFCLVLIFISLAPILSSTEPGQIFVEMKLE
jgi:hypothetical protein